MKLLIKNGNVINPTNKIDKISDILIYENKIESIKKNIIIKKDYKVIDAKGLFVIPGIIDVHTHLREPGHEEEETISTGTLSALKGGITSVFCMPNTHPVIDNQTAVEFIMFKARSEGKVNVFPIGAITKGSLGEELAEIGELKNVGVVGISDDGSPVMNSLVMLRALQYSRMFSLPVISHCEDKSLTEHGIMNEGYISTLLGLKGIPKEAEEIMVARDIILARLTGGHLHIAHVSTKGSVELIRSAKKQGINVSAETCPHYFTLTDEIVKNFDTNTKIKPPLRTKQDIEAIIEGLKDQTIDCIATDHAPHTEEEKNKEYELAPFGIIGLETLLPLCITELVKKKRLSLSETIAKFTTNPNRIFNINRGSLSAGEIADITIFDISEKKKIERFFSKSKNSPFLGWELYGFPVYTIISGKPVKL